MYLVFMVFMASGKLVIAIKFKQKTYGIKLLTENFDFRANHYDADEKQKFTNT